MHEFCSCLVDCRTWGKGFRKIGDSAYICLPKFEGRQLIHHCPSKYSIPEWYSMGLTEPCSCISVPYRGTMKKICPSPPLRGSFGKDLYTLPSLRLEKFAAAARYRGQWSDPRDFLRNGYKQRDYDDRALFRHRVVRIGHTVLRRPTAPTPFSTEYTPPANVVSTPTFASSYRQEDFVDRTGSTSNHAQPNPTTNFASVPQQLSSSVGNQFALNQHRNPASYSFQERSQIRPKALIQNIPFAPQLQQVPVNPFPTYHPQGSGDVDQPTSNQNNKIPNTVNGLKLNQNEQNALQQLQELSQNLQNHPRTFENSNASLLLPENILPTIIKKLQNQEQVPDSNSQLSTQLSDTPLDLARVPNQTPVPVAPTYVPEVDNAAVPRGAENDGQSTLKQNTETVDSNQAPDRALSHQDDMHPEQMNDTVGQYQKSAQPPEEQLAPSKSKESQMPVVIHTSSGRIVRIDPRFMDVSALMKVFHHNQNEVTTDKVLVKSNDDNDLYTKQTMNSADTTNDISTIGDTRRKSISH